jgi:hypothetical protein
MFVKHEFIPIFIIVLVLMQSWFDANNYNIKDLNVLKFIHNTSTTTVNNVHYLHITSKIGIPNSFDKDTMDYIWNSPLNYPFSQVRLNIGNNIIMISIKIDKPIPLNIDNLNTTLDSVNGILWAYGTSWEDALVTLYYSIFNITNKKLLIKTNYILTNNSKFEKKLITDIKNKLDEITDDPEIDYTASDFASDLATNPTNIQQVPSKYNTTQMDVEDTHSCNGSCSADRNNITDGLDSGWDWLPGIDNNTETYYAW